MAPGRQIPHHGEAIVLRTWPFHEADLLVSLLTREQGIVKGVARHAMRSRRRFGGALEPGTHVRAHYTEKPKEDLVRLDSFEIVWSPMSATVDWRRVAGMQLVLETVEQALPELAPEDNVYRLAQMVLETVSAGNVWLCTTYFALWMNRLMGWWPALGHCAVCGLDLRGETVFWSPNADAVTCADDRRSNSRGLSAESVMESHRLSRASLPELLSEGEWPRRRAADLRAFAIAVLERHLERRLRSAAMLTDGSGRA